MFSHTHHTSPQRQLFAWIALACVVLLGAMAAPFFLGRVYTRDDLGEYHLPTRDFYAQQLTRGEAFDWMPSLFCGFYVTGEGQIGSYHPLHWLLYRTLPLGAAFNLELLLSYPLMLLGMYALLRRLVHRRDASLFGALVFTFSGFCLLHFVHPNAIAVVAHIPWLLWAIDTRLSATTPGRAAFADGAICLLTASQLLLGYPQYVWFSLLAEVAFTLWRAAQATALNDDFGRSPVARVHAALPKACAVAEIAAAKVLGAIVAAIQLFPTIDALQNSTRTTVDTAFANSGSLHPLNLIQLAAPYLFETRVVGQNTHELGLYIGAVPCLLVVWLLSQPDLWRSRDRRLLWGAACFALLMLLLAAGEFGFVYSLQAYLPLVSRFRFPCRAIVLVHMAVAVLASLAFARLVMTSRRAASGAAAHSTISARPLWVCVIASGLLAVIAPLVWSEYVSSVSLMLVGPTLFAIAAALLWQAQRGRRWAIIGLVILTAADLGAYGLSYGVWPQTANLHEFVAAAPKPPANGPARIAAAADQRRLGNRLLLNGAQRADGYAGLVPGKKLDYRQVETLRLAGVGWVLRSEPQDGISGWEQVSEPAPRARLLELDEKTAATHGRGSLRAQVVEERPGHIALDVSTARPRLLALTESYHTGWQATVDGQVAPVVPVDCDFLGCLVPPGQHHVEFLFRPLSLKFGAFVSACGLGLLVSLIAVRSRYRFCLPKDLL